MTLYLNWKSNKSFSEIVEWFDQILVNNKQEVVLFPSFLHIYFCSMLIKDRGLTNFKLGAQDVSDYPMGSYTGSVNALQLAELCSHCIIGHSETRQTNKLNTLNLANKIDMLLDVNILPIICFDKPEDVNIEILNLAEQSKIKIAYEPTENIGTNKLASYEKLQNFHSKLGKLKYIYGGSVSEDNVDLFKKLDYIEGLLIGTASLKALSINRIVDIIN